MTAGGWPPAGTAHTGDDHSLAYPGFFRRAASLECHPGTEGRPEPGTGSHAHGWLPRNKAVTRPGADRALITERHPVPGSPPHGSPITDGRLRCHHARMTHIDQPILDVPDYPTLSIGLAWAEDRITDRYHSYLNRSGALRSGYRLCWLTPSAPAASQQAVVEAALVLLERMGLSPRRSGGRACEPGGGADVRRVRAGGVGDGQCRDAAGVRVVLEPGHRALGRPAPGRAHAVGDPAADGVGEDPRGGPPERAGRAQRAGAPGGRAALPVPAGGRRRADQRGRQPGPQGSQAAAAAVHPAGRARGPAGGDQRGRRDHG